MKRVFLPGLFVMFFMFFAASCTPVYKLQSGEYKMSVQDGMVSEKNREKNVTVMVTEGQIAISNPGSSQTLTGQLDKNQFTVVSQEGDMTVEFKGELAANNRVKGEAVHKKGEKTIFNAPFKLVPVN